MSVPEYHMHIPDIDSQTMCRRRQNFYIIVSLLAKLWQSSYRLLVADEFVILEILLQLVCDQETRSASADANHPDLSSLGVVLGLN